VPIFHEPAGDDLAEGCILPTWIVAAIAGCSPYVVRRAAWLGDVKAERGVNAGGWGTWLIDVEDGRRWAHDYTRGTWTRNRERTRDGL